MRDTTRLTVGILVSLAIIFGLGKGYQYIETQFRGGQEPKVSALPLNKLLIEPYIIYQDLGGEAIPKMKQLAEMQKKYKRLEVRGLCASGCTFVFGLWRRDTICYTWNARFGFHGAYIGEEFSPYMYKLLVDFNYPNWLRTVLPAYGWNDKDDSYSQKFEDNMLWLTGEQLGLQRCQD